MSPYIKLARRDVLTDEKVWVVGEAIDGPGELNFVLSYIAFNYLMSKRLRELLDGQVPLDGIGYKEMQEVYGAMTAAASEFYRRVMVPYEDKKRAENGDVYVNDDD